MRTESIPEARAWLRDNTNRQPFATNRFWRTGESMAFVESLYAAGAVEVLVDNIHPEHEAPEGGPYADTFIVKLPGDWAARLNVERLCEADGPGDVPPGDFRMDVRHTEIELWWD